MEEQTLKTYSAPLFLAWQLTNHCAGRCLACCEESGPANAWPDELSEAEALRITREIIALGIPYVAFGGGEPLGVAHCWRIFELLAAAGVAIKLETNGVLIDDAAAARLAQLGIGCVQISVDGATAETQRRMRPGLDPAAPLAAIRRLVAQGIAPQLVFVPTRLNLHEICATYDLARDLGCGAFVTGPLMRLGRAAVAYASLASPADAYARAIGELQDHAAATGNALPLALYPWDILTEIQVRLERPQAMLLVVPNGRVKLLNALPFAPGDLRRISLAQAWDTYRAAWESPRVRAFVARCARSPDWLQHANACWDMPELVLPWGCAA